MNEINPKVSAHLERDAVRHTVHQHDTFDARISSPNDFADALGYNVERICKTLLLRDADGRFAAAVSSAPRRLNMKKVAYALELVGRPQISSRDELERTTGYPPNGVSPLGLTAIAVVVDAAVLDFPTVLVGAGATGVEIELSPIDLVAATRARVAPISLSPTP